MTLVEFIAPILRKSHRDKILTILYYSQRYKSVDSLTVEDIRKDLKSSRIPRHNKINIADVLNKAGHFVDSPGLDGSKRLWKITDSGCQYVRDLLGLPATDPEIEHDVSSLTNLLTKIKNHEIQDYVNESLQCLKIDALRACIVFLWTGAIRHIQEKLLTKNKTNLNTAIKKHDSKAREISRIDNFAYIKDKTTLLAALDLGILDKNEKGILEEALNLRNKCGHPGKYKPGPKKVSSFIEDIVNILFS